MSVSTTAEIVIHPELCQDRDALLDLQARLKSEGAVLIAIGGVLEDDIAQWFDSRGGGSWAPLSPVTIAQKTHLGFGGMPDLVRSGVLRAGLTQRDAFGHKFLVSPHSITVGVYGTVIPYAVALNNGAPSRNLPARMLVPITAGARERITKILADWLGNSKAVSIYLQPPLTT